MRQHAGVESDGRFQLDLLVSVEIVEGAYSSSMAYEDLWRVRKECEAGHTLLCQT